MNLSYLELNTYISQAEKEEYLSNTWFDNVTDHLLLQ